MSTQNLTQNFEPGNPAPPLTPLLIFHCWLDLHRAGDLDAAALAIGDCVYSLTPEHRDEAVERIGHFVLIESGVTQ